jgi:hypothetical protein
MCRIASLILVLLVTASVCRAQTPGLDTGSQDQTYTQAAPAAEASAPAAPAVSNAEATGQSVVDLAKFISAYLADTGRLPDLVQVKTGTGNLRVLSTAEAFVLIARTADLWRTNGERPSAVPITPTDVQRPYLKPEDIPQANVDVSVGQEVSTEAFLMLANATVRWVDQEYRLPTSVFVDGERLTAAQYLAGLAICVEYADSRGGLDDTIFLPEFGPPLGWIETASAAQTPGEGSGEGEAAAAGSGGDSAAGAEQGTPEQSAGDQAAAENAAPKQPTVMEPMAPLAAEEEPGVAPQERPRLTVFPEPGRTVSGVVELVASYTGPPAKFVMFSIDNITRAIMNIPPFGYRWNTSALPPGSHSVGVQVLGEGNVVLLNQVSAYTVVAPKAKAPAEEQPEEF